MFLGTPYLFFGGKGGVGKTTCACSTALALLDAAKPGDRILLFSTDPAHSLSDSLDVAVGNQVRRVAEKKGAVVEAWEMDAPAALEAFKARHRSILAEIANRGTMLDDADINDLLNLSLPGMDEVMALFELSEFDRAGRYTRVVVDTAPSGHTSRLLELPDVFERWIAALDRMSEKHRYMVSQIARLPMRNDPVETFLTDMTGRVKRVRRILFASEQSSFLLVTIPEAMAVEETTRYLALLQSRRVPVTHVITNRVESVHNKCEYCAARVAAQRPHLDRIGEAFGALAQIHVPVLSGEVRGMESLRDYSGLLWTPSGRARVPLPVVKKVSGTTDTGFGAILQPRRVMIIGGKGGVGKTTTAAALAVQLAERHPDRRFLVFSTDPAHSLSDSFNEPIGEFKAGVSGFPNLDAIEINATARFDELKNRYRKWIEEIYTSLTGGANWEVQFDREAMQELISLAPPGIDEIAALSAVSNFLEKDSYASVVLDTAPTGHLLRFLELPNIALEWVRTFLRLLLKYRELVTSSEVAHELITLSRNIKRVIAILTNPKDCEFLAVAIPERMSLLETARLVEGIEKLHVDFGQVIINNAIPESAANNCAFCASRRASQQKHVEAFRKKFAASARLWIAPQRPAEVRGHAMLKHYFMSWNELAAARRKAVRSEG